MGKNKIDLTKQIDDDTKRGKTFFKRKRHFIKKGMELSNLCGQKILAVIYDEEKGRLVYYSSDLNFNIRRANEVIKECQKSKNQQYLEVYTNADYQTLNTLDYRTMRKKKRFHQFHMDNLDFIGNLVMSDDEDSDYDIMEAANKRTRRDFDAFQMTDRDKARLEEGLDRISTVSSHSDEQLQQIIPLEQAVPQEINSGAANKP
mmetsp:Transcript_34449/g.52725  ORF Transcript_34449/g.52725 Transcript_34449/m.52725 type:complete len:203 (+) Transcript_34449:62-670(+)|eukprot:CAMPEP_0170483752 /NCGR_PEP_ID=MMETSP0208-20121228/3366_1 /TAXON_ID=197538 /ORGANISM="Strombidium inclinatum, Strain S3" /LENGTH=202 /DNA_ID=CAMNT_0010756899 /DNA_START=32 /DNA_END=640 /DNA_ORIENTATION=+